MASYSLWWFEVVIGLLALMGLALVAREAAAFISIARIRKRDGGTPIPRTREEYLLLFPAACPRCMSRRSTRVIGWHRDSYGAAEFVDTSQCADCEYVASGRQILSRMLGAETTERHVIAPQRWFIRRREAERIEPPSLDPAEHRARTS